MTTMLQENTTKLIIPSLLELQMKSWGTEIVLFNLRKVWWGSLYKARSMK